MLGLGDTVVPFMSGRTPIEQTVTEIADVNGSYLYGISGHAAFLPEDKIRLVRSNELQPKYNIGDIIITDKNKDTCIRNGVTNDMVSGTIDAMEARVIGMRLTGDGDITYRYRTQTTSGLNICGTIDEADMPKHRQYSLF